MRIGRRQAPLAESPLEVTVAGKRLRLQPGMVIGSGGEAEIYDIGGGRALKLFKQPEHPDYASSLEDRQGALERITTHQKKLPALQQLTLPERVVAPLDLAFAGNSIAGFTMPILCNTEPLLRYADRAFRLKGTSWSTVMAMLEDLHRTVGALHRCGVVIGDFNDLNVLVSGQQAFLIDTDSIQFGPFVSRLYTARFLDPLLTDGKSLRLARPQCRESDWYAYTSMVLQTLLFVDAWGGVYRPARSSDRILHGERPLKRISIFHDDVRYPKQALPYRFLPDELLGFFHETFERDRRGELPIALLENLRWTRCSCGVEHARAICPACTSAAPRLARPLQIVRGNVISDRLFATSGVVVAVALEGDRVLWLASEDGRFVREDGTVVFTGEIDRTIAFHLQPRRTIVSRGGSTVLFEGARATQRISSDVLHGQALFEANGDHCYWIEGGLLFRDDSLGRETIGAVLDGRTQFWVGPSFGFGMSLAGGLVIGFLFDRQRRGINDSVALPPFVGELVTAETLFAADRCWLLTTVQEKGRLLRRCTVIHRDGAVEAQEEAEAGSLAWLDSASHGAASGSALFVSTDEGVVRVEIDGKHLRVASTFPDTESFVEAGTQLLISHKALIAVGPSQIQRLRIRAN